MFSDEALGRILNEADRIVCDAQELLDRAKATGQDDLVEVARHNLQLVIENRDRLSRVFSLKLVAADMEA
ncbi:MAG TPA: hypothetical protein VIG62_05670 [Blastocatellia bacterium]